MDTEIAPIRDAIARYSPRTELRELDYLGRFASVSTHDNGIVCREHEDTWLWRSDRPLAEYRPGPEVHSLVLHPLAALDALGEELVPHAEAIRALQLVTSQKRSS
jgi:hypothetical protein